MLRGHPLLIDIDMSYFRRSAVASQELLQKARELYESPERSKLNVEIGIQFPFSQIVDPTAPFIKSQFDGRQFGETIPLVVLSAFPKARLLLAVFDDGSIQYDQTITNFFHSQGIQVVQVMNFSLLNASTVFNSIVSYQGIQGNFGRLPVGHQHAAALDILRDRESLLNEFNPFMTLNEVRCSSVGCFRSEGVFSPNARHELAIWEYIKETSFDILVFDKESLEPVLAVEYDGDHHMSTEQQQKDSYKNQFCEAISLPLIRIDERFIPPDEYDLDSLTQEQLKTKFRQGLLIRFLGYASRQLQKHLEFTRLLEKHHREGMNGMQLVDFVFDEHQESEHLFDLMVRDDRRELEVEYRKLFGETPDVSFEELAESRIQGVLSWGRCSLKTPCGIRLQAFGLTNTPLDQLAKDFMFDWLVETRIAAHSQEGRPRRA